MSQDENKKLKDTTENKITEETDSDEEKEVHTIMESLEQEATQRGFLTTTPYQPIPQDNRERQDSEATSKYIMAIKSLRAEMVVHIVMPCILPRS